ncbi:MAG: MBL fold metallo-hydrolase [Candidatus Thermoplasmatota archaeon]
MLFKKIKSEGIAHNSYMIGDQGEAAVIDPKRDVDTYIKIAEKNQLKIKHIFETHRNEDYLIGSLELKDKTNAEIYHGSKTDFSYGNSIKQEDEFHVGHLKIKILETPGHTEESISLTLEEVDKNKVLIVFTGDLLFSGDTGRIDFFKGEKKQEMAEKMYNGIFNKILPLGKDVILCPAHGEGSVCGGEISNLEYTTLGYEIKTNPLLKQKKDEFINKKVNEHHYMPPYFEKMHKNNTEGPPILHGQLSLSPISINEIKKQKKLQILDIRHPVSYANSHIPNSLNIWRNGIPMFAGWFLNYNEPIVIVDDFNLEIQKVSRLLFRLGYDNILGYLKKGFSNWMGSDEKTNKINRVSPKELKTDLKNEDLFILDVRDKKTREKQGFIPQSKNIYLGEIPENLESIPEEKKIVVYCDSGFKTSIATSYLQKQKYKDLSNLTGGFKLWKLKDIPVS